MFTRTAQAWLETILEERFGHAFTILQKKDSIQLRLYDSERSIYFDQLQSIFHKSLSNFPCEIWKASSEKFEAPVDDCIPAPSEICLLYTSDAADE